MRQWSKQLYEMKDSGQQVLADHFAKDYKVSMPLVPTA